MATKMLMFVASLIAMLSLSGVADSSPLCRFYFLECCCEIQIPQIYTPAIVPAPGVIVDVVPHHVPVLQPIPEESKEVADASVEKKPARVNQDVEIIRSSPYVGPVYQRMTMVTKSVSFGYPQPMANPHVGGYISHPGYGSYKVHKVGVAWYDAMQMCASEGATLVVISSASEAALIKTMFSPNEQFPNAVNNMHFWVGVQERGVDGQFYTVFGDRLEQSGYLVWSPLAGGQPNDRGNTDCVSTFIEGGYFDDVCTAKYAFVCKKV